MKSQRKEIISTVLEAKQETSKIRKRWQWASASIWTDRMLEALENGVKGGKWFSLIDKVYRLSTLQEAFELVASRKGAAGVDGVSIKRFASGKGKFLPEISAAIEGGKYRPEPVRRVYIPKGNGKERPLGIPSVRDRVVQTALKLVLEPIFEKEFLPVSYGFRPGRGCKDALREVDRLLKQGCTWVVDADLQSYFDSIPHDRLMLRMKERISDGRILKLIEQFLEQDIMDDAGRWTPFNGTPQGAVLSPLLANVYLHGLDLLITGNGHKMVRYADDFVILCSSEEEAKTALEKVRKWTAENGLTLHPEKTHLGDCQVKGQGFEFLGYRFEAGRRFVRKKSMNGLRDKIREKTRRTCGKSLRSVIQSLNPTLKGWFEYFKHAYRTTFRDVDGFVRRRLRAILRKQEKRPGFGLCPADHAKWPNSFFAEHGLFTLETAYAAAIQSR